jgi:DNA-directed RNA polymerase subunit RPC12/RpoP
MENDTKKYMTNEMAIDYLLNPWNYHSSLEAHITAVDIAIAAIEKQIAKKPEKKHGRILEDTNVWDGYDYYVCPTCGEVLDGRKEYRKYPCPCGQLINWKGI